jgi:hypothetical protein
MSRPSVIKSQDPQDELDYTADFRAHCVRYREPGVDYNLGTAVEPVSATGFQYRATVAGRTAAKEPRWPTTAGQTVRDGSVVWTCEAPTGDSIERTIANAQWTGSGLTISTPTNSPTASRAFISGGILGQSYTVTIAGTFSDATVKALTFTLKIERPRVVG